jgi:membrane protease subunit HflK
MLNRKYALRLPRLWFDRSAKWVLTAYSPTAARQLIATAARRAQAGLDAAHSGLELSSLELTRLSPPRALASEFDAVQSAYIGAETKKKDAQAYAESTVPQARADANSAVQTDASSALAAARGDADAFRPLDREYRAQPEVVRERLYRDAVERAFAKASNIRWLPPPFGGNYHGFHTTVRSSDSSASFLKGSEDER